jgi:hypothetical protein
MVQGKQQFAGLNARTDLTAFADIAAIRRIIIATQYLAYINADYPLLNSKPLALSPISLFRITPAGLPPIDQCAGSIGLTALARLSPTARKSAWPNPPELRHSKDADRPEA